MKKLIILTLTLIVFNSLNAQSIKDYSVAEKSPQFYLGAGTGINNNCGLIGIKLGLRLNDRFLLDVGAGNGTWGNKIGLGLVLNAVNATAWCPSLSISRATGYLSTPEVLDVSKNGIVEKNKEVNIQINPATMFNLSLQRQWVRPISKNRIVLEVGYSILVAGGEFGLLDEPGYELEKNSKSKLNLRIPGGLMIGFSYNWAL